MKAPPLICFSISVENSSVGLFTSFPHNVPIHFEEIFLNDYWATIE